MKVYAIWRQSFHDIYGYEQPMYLNRDDAEKQMDAWMKKSLKSGGTEFKWDEEMKHYWNHDFNIRIDEIDVV